MYDIKNDGRQRLAFNKPYDDPYAVLSWHLVAVLSVKSLKSILTNNAFVKHMVIDEVKQLDVSGYFLDCIDEGIQKNWKTREKNKYLKTLGEYYFSELDLPRLREEVKKSAKEMGINLED